MTTFLLLRHARHDWLGRGIPGRLPEVSLNEDGHRQARELVQRFEGVALDAIYCSPQPRTQQTAQPLAAARGLPMGILTGVDEVDLGDWQGKSFREVEALGEPWRHWCERRGSAHPPGGEPFAEVPRRAMAALRELCDRHPAQTVLVVSHGDVIKAIVASCLNMSLDDLELFDIAPASVTKVVMEGEWSRVELLNATGAVA